MNTLTIPTTVTRTHRNHGLPATCRGRALYTVDWFMNGVVRTHQYDQDRLNLTHLHSMETGHVYA